MEGFSKFKIEYTNSRGNFLTAVISATNSTHALASLFNAVDVSTILVVRDLDVVSGVRYFDNHIDSRFILEDLS